MAQELTKGVVSILKPDMRPAGAGFFVRENLVVTCAHVISAAGSEPGGNVAIGFASSGSERRTAVVQNWGYSPVEAADIAFLSVQQVPKAVTPLVLGNGEARAGHICTTLGYPSATDGQSSFAVGTLAGRLIDRPYPKLQFESGTIQPGYSGAPVLDNKLDQVVGMVTWGYDAAHKIQVLAVPAQDILKKIEEHERKKKRMTAAILGLAVLVLLVLAGIFVWPRYIAPLLRPAAQPTAAALLPLPSASPPASNTQKPPVLMIVDDFDAGVDRWVTANKAVDVNESSTAIKEGTEAGQAGKSMWVAFDFTKSTGDFPKATYLLMFNPQENWIGFDEIQFRAKFIPDDSSGKAVKATIGINTGPDWCYHESVQYQAVGQAWVTLKFELKTHQFKKCSEDPKYRYPLDDADKVDQLAIFIIPDPDAARFSGAVLIDDIQLIKQP